jgi:hypothetical protein
VGNDYFCPMLKFYSNKISSSFFILLVFILLLGKSEISIAQKERNPFELTPRLENTSPSLNIKEVPASTPTGNPFDIKRGNITASQNAEIEPNKPATPNLVTPEKSKSNKSSEEKYRQFLFVTLLVLMVIVTLIFTIFRSVISASYRGFLNDNILGQLHRDQRGIASFPFQILYLLFFVNLGTFVFLILRHFGISLSESNLYGLLFCIGGVSLVFLLKHILLKIVSGIFPIQKEIGVYSFTIIVFNIILGIALLPFIIFISYGTEELISSIMYGSFALIGIFYIFRSLRVLFIGNRFLAYHKFHFLLYICTVEIVPLLILLKVLLLAEV